MTDWTQGPAKWLAAVVLGAASIVGITWSIADRRPVVATSAEPVGPAVVALDEPPRRAPTIISGRIDINNADAAELQLLTGIGPTLAQRIIDDRDANGRFATVDDLQRVRGIGPRTVEKIADMATAGD